MTEASRIQHLQKALAAHEGSKEPERSPFPLSRGRTMLPVVTIPVTVPLLNAKSFRIAPALRDHAQADLVKADPDNPEAQKIVADLVRKRHSHADALKESLRDEGQADPGVITRSGILINANTRCVLMRELLHEGQLRENAMRVAVLPEDVDPAELYDLEAVLQQQEDHKDEYDLVSALMMIRTLHEEGGMTAAQIAKRQRFSKAGVLLRFKMLALMERACLLTEPPLPIQEFGGKTTQYQNWKELVARVEKLDEEGDKEAGDNHLREFLQLHAIGMGAVHSLRSAPPGWVDNHLLGALAKNGGEIGSKIVTHAKGATNGTTPAGQTDSDTDGPDDDGLSLLDFGGGDGESGSKAVESVLAVTMKARGAGTTGEVELPDGSKVAAADVIDAITQSTKAALKDSKRVMEAGERLEKPKRLLEEARDALDDAIRALDEVIDDPEFAPAIPDIDSLLEDLATQVDEARETMERDDQS